MSTPWRLFLRPGFGGCSHQTPGFTLCLTAVPLELKVVLPSTRKVYIFQRPMHDTIGLLLSTEQMDVFTAYVIALWVFAGIYQVFCGGFGGCSHQTLGFTLCPWVEWVISETFCNKPSRLKSCGLSGYVEFVEFVNVFFSVKI
eukprot:s2930_g7.t1